MAAAYRLISKKPCSLKSYTNHPITCRSKLAHCLKIAAVLHAMDGIQIECVDLLQSVFYFKNFFAPLQSSRIVCKNSLTSKKSLI